jgi:hypothetical protein
VKLAAVFLAAAAVAAGAAAKERPVLGWDYTHQRLAWFDRTTLQTLPGRKPPLRDGPCSWSFSPDRTQLAYSSCNRDLEFVDTHTMRAGSTLYTSDRSLGHLNGLAWLRRDRLLATSYVDALPTLLVIDPQRRRVLRRVELARPAYHRTIVGARAVYLLGSADEFQPAQIAVADADGNVRTATVDRISTGDVVTHDEESDRPSVRTRGVGFAIDSQGRRAFVVSPELLIAEVDLTTLAVTYHGTTRSLAKSEDGPVRTAAWLGGGLLAVSGADLATTDSETTTTPYGLHVVDTRTWTVRSLDAAATGFEVVPGGLLVRRGDVTSPHETVAFAPGGTERWRLTLPPSQQLSVYGRYGYVCSHEMLVRVIDAATGATVARPRGRACAAVLDGPSSDV